MQTDLQLKYAIRDSKDLCYQIIAHNEPSRAAGAHLLHNFNIIERLSSDKVSDHSTLNPDNPAFSDPDIINILRQADDAVLNWGSAKYNPQRALREVLPYIDAWLYNAEIDPHIAESLRNGLRYYKLILTALLADSLHRTISASEDTHDRPSNSSLSKK